MQRRLSILLIVLLSFITLFPAAPVLAESNDNVYADGEYELPFEVWQDKKDEKSVADGYFEKPAKLIVENGQYTVQATLKNSSWWQYFKVQSGDSFVDVEEISQDTSTDTKVIQFKVKNLNEILNAKVHIIVTGIPGFNYDNKYDIRFKFDPTNIPISSDEEDQDEEESADNGSKVIQLTNGEYTIQFDALHATEDKVSGMARYIEDTANITVKDGKTLLTLTLTDHKTVTGFQVEGKEPIKQEVNEVDNTRDVTYELEQLTTMMDAQVQYTVGNFSGDHSLRLFFKEDTLSVINGQQDNEVVDEDEVIENKDEEEKNEPTQNKENNKKTETTKSESEGTQVIDPKNLQDGEYTIEYKVLKNNTNEVSVMNEYVVSPAYLKVKNGEKFVAITLKNSSWITDFKVEQDGKLIAPTTLSTDSKADTRVVEFQVEDLYKKLPAWVKVDFDIPGLSYHHEYDVQFKFDPSSIKLLKADQTYPEKGKIEDERSDTNIEKVNKSNEKSEDVPAFDRNSDQSNDESNNSLESNAGSENPKTADKAKIFMFASLLIGSFIPLMIKLKRRLNPSL